MIDPLADLSELQLTDEIELPALLWECVEKLVNIWQTYLKLNRRIKWQIIHQIV